MLLPASLLFLSAGCAVDAEPSIDSDVLRSLEQLAVEDDCDSTAQCKVKYGEQATDCRNSASSTSTCICSGGAVCQASNPSEPPSPSNGSVHFKNLGQNAHMLAESRLDGSADEGCGGVDASNVKAAPSSQTGAQTQFSIVPVEGEWFRVVSSDGKFLQCTNLADGNDGLAVRMASASCTGTWTQWRKVDAGNGNFRLENRAHGRWLQANNQTDVDSGSGNHLRAVTTGFDGNLTRWSTTNVADSGGGTGGGGTDKPNVWILTDMSDPSLNANDPDDVVATAMYLMNSNRFNTASITVSSTHRSQVRNAPNQATWANNYLGAAYRKAVPCLNEEFGGYTSSLPWRFSSLSTGSSTRKFNSSDNYSNLSSLTTVQDLVNYAKNNEVYVLVWGPLTEAAMAVKHLKSSGDTQTLKNIKIISHWTTSFISQGSPSAPFEVANCKDDRAACDYLHSVGKSDSNVTFYDIGSIGQSGIVSGSPSNFSWSDFRDSSIGKIFVDAKFAFGKPDGSDAGTFYTLLGNYGVRLSDFNNNGVLTQATEEATRDDFRSAAPRLISDLLKISDVAARCN